MSARLLITPTASYEEWKAKRAELSRTAVTASEIAIVLGISPWGSAFNLYHLKRGTITDDFEDNAMSLGRHLEPWIADRWAEDHPEFGVDITGLWQSEDRPWQMATPDRYLWGLAAGERDWRKHDSLLEIKSSAGYEGWGEDGTDEIPAHIRAQVLWQLDTLGLTKGHVTCWFKHTDQRRDYVIAYDEADVDLMRCEAHSFLEAVKHGDPPPIDASAATGHALMKLWPTVEDHEAIVPAGLRRRYHAALVAQKKAKERVKRAENEIRARIGNAKTVLDPTGEKVATRSKYEVREHVRAAYTVDKLVPPRAKKG
ncbi:lambda-exonuclease family protein [Actinomadura litoris]|uniref:lambda-exonuclease family protein n=1 Tax=Actinomadura litoris TaxID=2678616 RepID=UPI001FA80C8F|nr:YqaJ viral recombinase family protein [Actinomadura litoris]